MMCANGCQLPPETVPADLSGEALPALPTLEQCHTGGRFGSHDGQGFPVPHIMIFKMDYSLGWYCLIQLLFLIQPWIEDDGNITQIQDCHGSHWAIDQRTMGCDCNFCKFLSSYMHVGCCWESATQPTLYLPHTFNLASFELQSDSWMITCWRKTRILWPKLQELLSATQSHVRLLLCWGAGHFLQVKVTF